MTQHYNRDKDLDEAVKMAESFHDYIQSDDVYGNIGGGMFSGGSMPKLTGGALLMRLRRLEARRDAMTDRQRKQLDAAQDLLAVERSEWTLHYEQKLIREAHSRLDAMRPFFQECGDNPRLCPSIYKPELLRRTVVQEILRELEARNVEHDDLIAKRQGVDGKLRGFVASAQFQWDEALKDLYPAREFWWLYSAPPLPDDTKN